MLSIFSSAVRTATGNKYGLASDLACNPENAQHSSKHEERKREELHRQYMQNQRFLRHWGN